MTQDPARLKYLARLREQLVILFTRDEFILLCGDLGIQYDELTPGGLGLQAGELIRRLDNVDQIDKLVSYASEKRPKVSWDDRESLGLVLTETEDELKGNLAKFHDSFQSALQQIDILSDYKDLHDELHDLQFGWFPLVQEKVAGLPDAKGAIRDLRGHERDLRNQIEKLNDIVDGKKVPEAEREWINKLEEARQNLKRGISSAEPDLILIRGAVASIRQVVDTQPTSINRDLLLAVGALRLPELRNMVQLVLTKLDERGAHPTIIEKFTRGIADLEKMSSDLDALMEEHDIWQECVSKSPMLEIAFDNLAFFNTLWKQLKEKASRLYADKQEEWANDLQVAEANLDKAIEANDSGGAKDAFDSFCDAAKRRFWNVDKLIKKKCKELSEIRSKMPDRQLA